MSRNLLWLGPRWILGLQRQKRITTALPSLVAVRDHGLIQSFSSRHGLRLLSSGNSKDGEDRSKVSDVLEKGNRDEAGNADSSDASHQRKPKKASAIRKVPSKKIVEMTNENDDEDRIGARLAAEDLERMFPNHGMRVNTKIFAGNDDEDVRDLSASRKKKGGGARSSDVENDDRKSAARPKQDYRVIKREEPSMRQGRQNNIRERDNEDDWKSEDRSSRFSKNKDEFRSKSNSNGDRRSNDRRETKAYGDYPSSNDRRRNGRFEMDDRQGDFRRNDNDSRRNGRFEMDDRQGSFRRNDKDPRMLKSRRPQRENEDDRMSDRRFPMGSRGGDKQNRPPRVSEQSEDNRREGRSMKEPMDTEEDDELDAEVRRSVEEFNRKQQLKVNKKNYSSDSSALLDSDNFESSALNENWRASSSRSSPSSVRGKYSPKDEQAERDRFGDKLELSSPKENEFFYGKHPIQVALHWVAPDVLAQSRLIVQEGSDAQNGPEVKLAKSKGVRVEISSKMRMNEVLGSSDGFARPHQGLIIELPRMEYTTIKKETVIGIPPDAKDVPVLVLALDEVMDPMNLGAILRSAHFFNVFAVLASEKNSAPLSGTTTKASAGATFVMHAERRLLGTKNLVASLQAHRKAGWRVVGTSPSSTSADGKPVTTPSSLEAHPRTILVMGNEETGLRALVREECDVLLHLPRPPKPPATMASTHSNKQQEQQVNEESKIALNVSAASAALLARLRL